MSDDEIETFEATGAGASMTIPVQCSSLRKGGYVCIKGRPCKIVEMSTSKTGKHGHAKAHLVALDIFTGKKLEELCPSTHNLEVPVLQRDEFQVMDVSEDGFVSVLTNEGEAKDDLKLPEGELGEQLKNDFDEGKDLLVQVIAAMGQECIVSIKESSGQE